PAAVAAALPAAGGNAESQKAGDPRCHRAGGGGAGTTTGTRVEGAGTRGVGPAPPAGQAPMRRPDMVADMRIAAPLGPGTSWVIARSRLVGVYRPCVVIRIVPGRPGTGQLTCIRIMPFA